MLFSIFFVRICSDISNIFVFFCFLDMNTIGYSYRNQYKCQTLYSSKGEASDQNRSQLNTTLQPGHNSLSRKKQRETETEKEGKTESSHPPVCLHFSLSKNTEIERNRPPACVHLTHSLTPEEKLKQNPVSILH